jgi:hypothetical protein
MSLAFGARKSLQGDVRRCNLINKALIACRRLCGELSGAAQSHAADQAAAEAIGRHLRKARARSEVVVPTAALVNDSEDRSSAKDAADVGLHVNDKG